MQQFLLVYNESKHAFLLQEGDVQTLGNEEARKLADAKMWKGVGYYTVERYKKFVINEGVEPPTFFPDTAPKTILDLQAPKLIAPGVPDKDHK